MRDLIACRLVFFLLAFYVGNWTIRIPDIKDQVNTDYAGIGLNGMAFALGAVLMMIISGSVIRRLSTRRAIFYSAWVIAFGFFGVPFANNLPFLMLLSFVTGIAVGLTEVSMNAQASNLEVIHGKSMMSGFHAFFSLGLLLGSLFASGIVELNLNLLVHFCGLIIILLPLSLIFARFLIKDPTDSGKSSKNSIFFLWPGVIIILVFLAVSGAVLEGAVDSWSALYMQDVVAVDGFKIGLGVAVFNTFMVLGRLFGDRLGDVFGVKKFLVIQLLFGIAASFVLFRYAGLWSSIVGFGLAGLGVSNLVPIAYSQAGKNPNIETPTAIAIVSIFSYGAFMFGPPLEGLIADWFGLPAIFLAMFLLFVVALMVIAAWGGRRLDRVVSEG